MRYLLEYLDDYCFAYLPTSAKASGIIFYQWTSILCINRDYNSITTYKNKVKREHHPFCNFYMLPRKNCSMCSGGKGMWATYPLYKRTIDDVLLNEFPDVMRLR